MSKLPRIFLANVGVNASHEGQGLKSPRFADGSFEFVTIPEQPILQNLNDSARKLKRYRDFSCFNEPERSLAEFLPNRVHSLATHYDPEFEQFTYGDECESNARAAGLKLARPGDLLFFLARLIDYDTRSKKFTNQAGFYLIGFLEIAEILAQVRKPLSEKEQIKYGHNAHVRRAEALPERFYDGFYVFKGSARSQRFRVAVSFGRAQAELTLRDRNGNEWAWDSGRSELQIIGSYTRACRCVLDPAAGPAQHERTRLFLEMVGLADFSGDKP